MLATVPEPGSALAWPILGWGWAAAALLMAALYFRQIQTRNATAVDVGWAFALGALSVSYALLADGAVLQRWIAGLAGGLWGGRLALHLATDRLFREREEDGRYQSLRDHWGDRAQLNFAGFYQAQAIVAVVLSLPFFLASHNQSAVLLPMQWVGVVACAIGILGEGIADRQLARFRAKPAHRGQTCRAGLWRYSRHPNYFFEWVTWCGFALIAAPAPFGWWALLAPALMFVLLRWVTGIPHTEAQSLRSRGDDYRRYQETTSALIPWFPKKTGAHETRNAT